MEEKNTQPKNNQVDGSAGDPPAAGETFHPQPPASDNTAASPETNTTTPPPDSTTESAAPVVGPTPMQGSAHNSVQSGSSSSAAEPKSKRTGLLLGGAALIVALLVGGAYAAYAQVVMPERALAQYAQRIADFESGHYQVELHAESDEDSAPTELRMTSTGSFSAVDEDDFRFDSDNDITISTSGGGLGIDLDLNLALRYLDETLYARSSDTEFLQAFLPALEDNTWYSFDIEEGDTEDYIDNTCTSADREAMENYFENELSDRVEITDAQRHTWFPMERNGERVQHYSGVLEGSILVTITGDLVERTSEDCLDEEDIAGVEDVADVSLAYNLYTGNDYDELDILVRDENEDVASVMLITSDYNQSVEIAAPEDATPFEQLMQGQMGMFGFDQEMEGFENDAFGGDFEQEMPDDFDFSPEPEFR